MKALIFFGRQKASRTPCVNYSIDFEYLAAVTVEFKLLSNSQLYVFVNGVTKRADRANISFVNSTTYGN